MSNQLLADKYCNHIKTFDKRTPKEYKEHVAFEIAANKLCAMVGKVLQKHYPGWQWFVECLQGTGVLTVKNLSIHGDYGFIIHLHQLMNDTELKLPILAGGELLERCNFPRGAMPERLEVDRDIKNNVIDIDTQGA
jgi:hypothetical protein